MSKVYESRKSKRKLDFSGRLKDRKKEKKATAFSESKRKNVRTEVIDILRSVQHDKPRYGKKRERKMAKRKRTYTRYPRRRYKRRSYPSAASLARRIAKAQAGYGPFGDINSAQFKRYGPSNRQIRENPGWARTALQSQNRIADNYRGDGDYLSAIETGAMTGAGGMAALSSLTGGTLTLPMALGGAIAGGVVGAADEYMGRGDYGILKDIAISAKNYYGLGDYGKTANQIVTGSRQPISVNQGADRTGDIYIQQTEFIGNLTATKSSAGSSDFKMETYEINPGNKTLFPFLSQIAQNYELYEWVGLMVAFKPTTGEGGESNQLGKVVITTNYDPNCRDFANSLEMQNYDYASSGKPSQTIIHGIETAPGSRATRMLYVRDELESSKDKEFTDVGKLFVATEGIHIAQGGSNVILGELHVTYKIRLSRAKLYAHIGSGILYQNLLIKTVEDSAVRTNKNEGHELFKVEDSTAQKVVFRLADKNLVTKAVRVIVHFYETDGTAGDRQLQLILNDPELYVKKGSELTNFTAPHTSILDDDYLEAGTSSDLYSMIMFDLCINNPSDKTPSFHISCKSGGVADSFINFPPGQMYVTMTEIETFDPDTKYTLLEDFA